jgi:hypothetical protein
MFILFHIVQKLFPHKFIIAYYKALIKFICAVAKVLCITIKTQISSI